MRDASFRSWFVVALAWEVAGAALTVHAQTGAANVQGVARDPSGARVAQAEVTLAAVETNRRWESRTNSAGFYLLAAVPPGRYRLSVRAPGFQTWEAELLLQIGQTAVVDAALVLERATTEVTVTEARSIVNSSGPTLDNIVDSARVEQLPLNGRFLQSLIQKTTPGLEGSASNPKVYGLRHAAMDFLQDGAVIVNRDVGTISDRPPGLDAIDEIRVETSVSSAKMNRPATTILTTKRGTNTLHGAAFETHRNAGFGTARRREDFYDKPPHLVRNEFGASVGGPLIKDRTFFFAAFEALRHFSDVTTASRVPTLAMRQGDFSGLVDATGRRITLYDPWTTDPVTWQRQPFPNNVIPSGRISPLARYLYSVTPAPTHPEVNPLAGDNYFGPGVANRTDHTETLRIDHQLSHRDQLFLRTTHGNRSNKDRSGGNGSPVMLDEAGNVTFRKTRQDSAVLSWTRMFSTTLFGETIASGSSEDTSIFVGTDHLNHAERLRLPNPFGETGFPNIGGTGPGFMQYTYADNRRRAKTKVFQLDQSFVKVAGRHELQLGGRFRYERLDTLPDQQFVQGSHNFSSLATALYDPASGSSFGPVPNTGHDAANLFLGTAGQYQVQFTRKWYQMSAREYALYLQDNLRLGQRLTLNLGLRGEYYPAILERNNLLAGFDPKTKSVVNGVTLERMYPLGATTPQIVSSFTRIGVPFVTPEQVGLPPQLIRQNGIELRPRAGFAWRLGSSGRETVIRGGYGLYGFPIPLRSFNARMRSNPPTNARFTLSYNSAAQSPDGRPNYLLRSVPSIIAGVNSEAVLDPNNPAVVTPVVRGSFRTSFFDPDQPTTLAHQWNLTLERELRKDTLVRVGYVRTHGGRLDQFNTINENPTDYVWFVTTGLPLPTGEFSGVARRGFDQTVYGTIEEYQKSGWSDYNGAVLELQKRYSRGYGFQAFYVFSRAFRAGGNQWGDDFIRGLHEFLPGAVPGDEQERNRLLNHHLDSDVQRHRVRLNWIVDLPLGRGKKLAGGANGWLDRVIGGWQVAGFAVANSTWFALPTSNWGELGPIEIYGKRYKIEDCRSGRCIPGYLWYNGYIPANRINSRDATGRPNGVMGVPPSYRPSHRPVIPIPADGGSRSDPNFAFYETNTVFVPLRNGTLQRTTLNTNLHPWRNQYRPGPWRYNADLSLFKTIPIRGRLKMRLNIDCFNVFNMPGLNLPDPVSGIVSLQKSAEEPRRLQVTGRLTW